MPITEELTFLNSTFPPIDLHWGNMPKIMRFKQHYFKLYSIEDYWRLQIFSASMGELQREIDLSGRAEDMGFVSFGSITEDRILIKFTEGGEFAHRMMIDGYDTDSYQMSQEPEESSNDEYGLYPDYEPGREGFFDYSAIYGTKTIQIPGGRAESRGWKSYTGDMTATTILIFNRIQQKDQYVTVIREEPDIPPVLLKTLEDPKYGYPDMKTSDMCDMQCEDTDAYICTDDGILWKLEYRDWQWHRLQKIVDLSDNEKAPMVGCATDTCVVLQQTSANNTTQRVFAAYINPLSLAEIAFHLVFQRVSPTIKHKLLEAQVVDTKTILELLKVS